MRALFAIPLGGILWAPWSYRHRRDAAAVKCSEGVRGGWSGRTRRSPSLLLAIYRPLSLTGLCRRAPLLLAINVSRSRRSAASIRLARRATLTDAVALETRAVTIRLVASDPVGHLQEKDRSEHVANCFVFRRGGPDLNPFLMRLEHLGDRGYVLKAPGCGKLNFREM